MLSVLLGKTAWFYATTLQCHVYTNCSSWHPGSNQTCGSTDSNTAYCSWTWARSKAGQETASNSQSKYLTHNSRRKYVTSCMAHNSRMSYSLLSGKKELNIVRLCGINLWCMLRSLCGSVDVIHKAQKYYEEMDEPWFSHVLLLTLQLYSVCVSA
jgi:hypothetical protein